MRGPNWRGLGKSKVPVVSAVREASAEDVDRLRRQPQLPKAENRRIHKLKDWHHNLAILFASGYTNSEVSEETGRSLASIGNFRNDPMMEELVAAYRDQVQGRRLDFESRRIALKAQRAMLAEEMLTERYQDAADGGEPIPTRDLHTTVVDYDRKFGPIELKAQVNVTSFESAMERGWEERMARARARSAGPKLIEAQPVELPTDLRLDSSPRPESEAPLLVTRRHL